jgi:MFS superfamily sulfate permease-like transporter
MKQYLRSDLFSSFMVALVSIPFCIAGALAFGLPVYAGLITCLVGGILITFIGNAKVGIKAPSLGLLLVFGTIVQSYDGGITGFQKALAVLAVAGVIQSLFGVFRFAKWLDITPEAVIYGLLASVGIIILVHQSYFLIGIVPQELRLSSLFINFFINLSSLKLEILLVSVLGLLIIFGISSIKSQDLLIFPFPLVAIICCMVLASYLDVEHLEDGVYFPPHFLWSSFQLIIVDFSHIGSFNFWYFAVVLAVFGSLETLLNVKSHDALDFLRRKSYPNRELFAIGIGNILVAFLGGLPMVVSYEYTAININSRGKSLLSSFFHAFWVVVMGALMLQLVYYIPLAGFASVLVYQAYKLTSPVLAKEIFAIGKWQFLLFSVTVFVALLGGILFGYLAGLITSFVVFLILGARPKHFFLLGTNTVKFGESYKIGVKTPALASNYYVLVSEIKKLPKDTSVYVDFESSAIVDHNFMEMLYHHPYNFSNVIGEIGVQGIDDHIPVSSHPLATRILPLEEDDSLLSKAEKRAKFMEKEENRSRMPLLNPRQINVLSIASSFNAKMRPQVTYDGNKLHGFRFTLGYEIKYRENKFNKNFKSKKFNQLTKMEFSDVFLSKGIRMSEQNQFMSVVLVSNFAVFVPDFTLNKEGIISNILQTVGYNDIDFEDFPMFSQLYLLRGSKESEIRTFFTPKIIEFLQKNVDYHIEGLDGKLIIYKNIELLSRTEMEDCIGFAEQLIRNMYEEMEEVVNVE